MRTLRLTVAASITALLVAATPAVAFDTKQLGQLGSIALDMDELAGVIKQSDRLKHETDQALAKIGKRPDELMCDAMRFPGAWRGLAGLRVSPYICEFGGKWLKIVTRVRLTGKDGKSFARATKGAMRHATSIRETSPSWTWSDTKPSIP
ncbi:MAG: hypothetical protein QOD74_2191 [Variibacter sp.]|jgi:hypothetical protein|nr:hypothetical protein [Variibacter sp.]